MSTSETVDRIFGYYGVQIARECDAGAGAVGAPEHLFARAGDELHAIGVSSVGLASANTNAPGANQHAVIDAQWTLKGRFPAEAERDQVDCGAGRTGAGQGADEE